MATDDEMCLICRSSAYLNPNMRFLINPECYHKICESCVDRIFGSGPAPCPYRGCTKTLRRQRFKTQVFEDLKVEREVDVRQRIHKVYNRPESSFATKKEYDDFLEHIEELIFSIADAKSEEEKMAVEEEVKKYELDHKQEILENALKLRRDIQQEEEFQKQQQERDRRLRMLAHELEQQEREHKRIMQEEQVATLAAGKDADLAVKEAADRALQRTNLLRQQYEMELERSKLAARIATPNIEEEEQTQPPFTPFAGDRTQLLFTQMAEYFDPLLTQLSTDPTFRAGGFTAEFAEHGALVSAFASIDVDIQGELVSPEVRMEIVTN